MKIRKFCPSDAEPCFRIRSEAFIKLFYDEIGPKAVVAGINGYLPHKYLEINESIPIFVAVDGQKQIGFIASRFIGSTSIEILFLYIRLDYLRKGIGSKLMNFLERWILKHHPEVKRIIVDTVVPQYNLQFYEKNGYFKTRESECKYPDGSIAAIRLEKKLSECD